jgi:hypothetical protein
MPNSRQFHPPPKPLGRQHPTATHHWFGVMAAPGTITVRNQRELDAKNLRQQWLGFIKQPMMPLASISAH